jgi:hypothetical protein
MHTSQYLQKPHKYLYIKNVELVVVQKNKSVPYDDNNKTEEGLIPPTANHKYRNIKSFSTVTAIYNLGTSAVQTCSSAVSSLPAPLGQFTTFMIKE